MSWHRSYEERVLGADYRFAATHLKEHVVDALVAHVRTVAALPAAEGEAATMEALERALQAQRGIEPPPKDPDVPDLYHALQRAVERESGPEALGWLRLGLSRNDLDMTIYKLRARTVALTTLRGLLDLLDALVGTAEAHVDTVFVASTHHRPAQPTTLGHYLAGISSVVARDVERALQAYARLDTCPMGAAALAGSSHPLDRALTARLLGFASPVESTYDAVASSDWQVDVANVATSVALTLSRLTCDLIDWTGRGWLHVADALTQGSSIMPQKRNPVALEHARTRLSRALGAAQMVTLSSHNIPYGDLNDFGPDVQGALQTLHAQLVGGLDLLHACLTESRFDEGALARSLEATDTTATELADELVRITGLPFQEAHRAVAALVDRMTERGRPFLEADPADLRAVGGPDVPGEVLSAALSPRAFVERRTGLGGPAPSSVRVHLARLRRQAEEYSGAVESAAARMEAAQHALRAPGKDAYA